MSVLSKLIMFTSEHQRSRVKEIMATRLWHKQVYITVKKDANSIDEKKNV